MSGAVRQSAGLYDGINDNINILGEIGKSIASTRDTLKSLGRDQSSTGNKVLKPLAFSPDAKILLPYGRALPARLMILYPKMGGRRPPLWMFSFCFAGHSLCP